MDLRRGLSVGYLVAVVACIVAVTRTSGPVSVVLSLLVVVLTFPFSIPAYALTYFFTLASGWLFYERGFWIIAFPLFTLAAIAQVLLARYVVRAWQKYHRRSDA